MATRPFWLMIGVVLLMSSCLQGIGIHTAPLLSDRGLDRAARRSCSASSAPSGSSDRGDQVPVRPLLRAARRDRHLRLAAAAAFVLVGVPGLLVAIAAVMLVTVGSGAESDFVGYLVGRYFGLKAYGQIFGVIYGMFMVGIAIGPALFGYLFDRFHTPHGSRSRWRRVGA